MMLAATLQSGQPPTAGQVLERPLLAPEVQLHGEMQGSGRPARVLSLGRLRTQNRRYRGSGGVSAENRGAGFRPGFLDRRTGLVYLSQFPDGSPAPVHLLDGLPSELVVERTAAGRVTAVRDSVVAGFVRDGPFLTRDEAMAELAERGREVLYA